MLTEAERKILNFESMLKDMQLEQGNDQFKMTSLAEEKAKLQGELKEMQENEKKLQKLTTDLQRKLDEAVKDLQLQQSENSSYK